MALSQSYAGLLLNAAQRADRYVALGMRNGDAPRLGGMLELDVAALMGHLTPTIGNQR
jgi:hypothetical protein